MGTPMCRQKSLAVKRKRMLGWQLESTAGGGLSKDGRDLDMFKN